MATPKGGRPVYNPSPAIQTSINQGGALKAVANPSALKDWQQVVDQDENLRGLSPEAATNYLRATWGLPSTYKLDPQGNIVDSHGFLMRNLWWIGPAALVGGSAIGAAVGGSTAAAPTALGTVEGATAIHAVPPAVTAATTGGTSLAAPTLGGTFMGGLKKFAGSLSAREWLDTVGLGLQTGVNIWGANKAADASAEAARIQADAYREGLAFLTKQWEKYNADFEPYLKAGQAAIGRLSTAASERPPLPITPDAVLAKRLTGAPALGAFGQPQPRPTAAPPTPPVLPSSAPPSPDAPPVSTKMPAPTTTRQPVPVDDATLGAYGQPPVSSAMPVAPRPQLVKIQAPDGEVREMPEQMANAFLARGARRIA